MARAGKSCPLSVALGISFKYLLKYTDNTLTNIEQAEKIINLLRLLSGQSLSCTDRQCKRTGNRTQVSCGWKLVGQKCYKIAISPNSNSSRYVPLREMCKTITIVGNCRLIVTGDDFAPLICDDFAPGHGCLGA